MTENKKNMVFSDIDASITRLLHGLNYDNFQKQQDFLKSIKGNQETNNIVNGILDLLDRVADLYENTTGKSLTNRFETIDNYIELLLQLENATDMEYTISEFIFHASGNSVSSDDALGYAHIRFKNILCTIGVTCGDFVTIGPIYVLETDDNTVPFERISRKTFNFLLKDATFLTPEEMEAAELCTGGKIDDLR